MEKALQLDVSVPFDASRLPDTVSGIWLYRHSDRELVMRYVQTLIHEMEESAEDWSDVRIDAVRLVGGTVHALNNRQLDMLMEAVRRLFRLTADCEIVGTVSPGFFNTLPTEAMKAHGVSALMDVPSFDREECQRRGMPYRGALSFGDVTDAGISVFGVRTLCGLADRTAAAWAAVADAIVRRKPNVVELADAGETEDTVQRAAFDARLAALGYGAYEKNGYALVPPVSRMHPQGESLGVGLGALCRFDGYETRNTQDIRLYLDADGDFAKICASAKPI